MKKTATKAEPFFKVRRSRIHGSGVFAAQSIRKGARIVEYIGDRVSHDAADERYQDRPDDDNHTFLFIVDSKTVIDAGVGGNEARFINHGCDPNCETVIEKRRVFIEAIRTIQPGDELFYDYMIKRDRDDPPNVDQVFACRCGAKNCRGTMLEPKKLPRARKKAKSTVKAKAKSKAKSKVRTKSRAKSKVKAKSTVSRKKK